MKKLRVKSLITTLFLVACFAAGAFYAFRSGLFRIATIKVEILNGNEISSDNLVHEIKEKLNLKMQSYVGLDIWSVALSDLNLKLQGSSWVEQSEIHRELPDTIDIHVRLKPIASVLVNDRGQMLPVSVSGELMDSVISSQVPNVPVLVGNIFEKNDTVRKKAVQLISDIPNRGLFSRANVSEVHYKPQDGFWVTMIQSGMQVKLGEEQVGIKSERVAQVLEYIQSHSLDARVIDANLSKKVLVRLRKEP